MAKHMPNESTVSLESTAFGLVLKVDGKVVQGVTRLDVVHGEKGQEVVVRFPMCLVKTEATAQPEGRDGDATL